MVPVTNAMDGFATSHMQCETQLPEPEMLKEFLGDPAGRIKCPTLAQEMLYGARPATLEVAGGEASIRLELAPLESVILRLVP